MSQSAFTTAKASAPYQAIRTLQETLFGQVKLCRHNSSNTLVAVKMSRRAGHRLKTPDDRLLEDPQQEIHIMRKLSTVGGHSHVLRLLDSHSDRIHTWSVLEYCPNGEMFDFISKNGALALNDARRYFSQLITGVHYLHSQHVAHLDLSLENLLLTGDNELKISDFGMARVLTPRASLPLIREDCASSPSSPASPSLVQDNVAMDHSRSPSPIPAPSPRFNRSYSGKVIVLESSIDGKELREVTHEEEPQFEPLEGRPGKFGYMAPEVYDGRAFDGPAADVFSCGVILFMMVTGLPPFKIPSARDERYRMISAGELRKLIVAWGCPDLPQHATDLLSAMLCPEDKRITLKQILRHPFLRGQHADTQSPSHSFAAGAFASQSPAVAVARAEQSTVTCSIETSMTTD